MSEYDFTTGEWRGPSLSRLGGRLCFYNVKRIVFCPPGPPGGGDLLLKQTVQIPVSFHHQTSRVTRCQMTDPYCDTSESFASLMSFTEKSQSVLQENIPFGGGPQEGPDTWGQLGGASTQKVTTDKSYKNDNSTTNPTLPEGEPCNKMDFEQNGAVDFNGSLEGGLENATLDEEGQEPSYTMEDLGRYTSMVEPQVTYDWNPLKGVFVNTTPVTIAEALSATTTTITATTTAIAATSMTLTTNTNLATTFANTHPLVSKMVFGSDNSTTVQKVAHLPTTPCADRVVDTATPRNLLLSASIKSSYPGISTTLNAGGMITKIKTTVVPVIAAKKAVVIGVFDSYKLVSTGQKYDAQMRVVDIWPAGQPKGKKWYDPEELHFDITTGARRLLNDDEKIKSERMYSRRSKNCLNAVGTRLKNKNTVESLHQENADLKAKNLPLEEENARLKAEHVPLQILVAQLEKEILLMKTTAVMAVK